MRVLFTGGTSPLGSRVLSELLRDPSVGECWCSIHRRKLTFDHPKLRTFPLDLEEAVDLSPVPSSIDQVVHFAALAQSFESDRYWQVNHRATLDLARQAREKGCKSFVYISSWRAIDGAGAYGESKLATEKALLAMPWQSLVILRPSEVFGTGGNEGIDRLSYLARKFRVVPMIFGNSAVHFLPLFCEDFVRLTAQYIIPPREGVHVLNFPGPETLNGVQVAMRLASRYRALPMPVWWPLLSLGDRVSRWLKRPLFSPDQLSRITSPRAHLDQEESVANVGFRRFP